MSRVGTQAKVLLKLELKTDESQATNCYIFTLRAEKQVAIVCKQGCNIGL